jgi:citrate lyase beta subunit
MHPTLYTPATTPPLKLFKLASGVTLPDLRRLVVCTEDSVAEEDLLLALSNVEALLKRFQPKECAVYIRARNATIMEALLGLPGIEKVTGFVIPKANPSTFPGFADLVTQSNSTRSTSFTLMPIMESIFLPDQAFRNELRAMFDSDPYKSLIECLRIGANDLMGYHGIRRDPHEFTVYNTPVGLTISTILNEFRVLSGFTVTAPVFECFSPDYDKAFQLEARESITAYQLFGQTLIHPRHLQIILDMYKVSDADNISARSILASSRAVNGLDGRMDERATHYLWAQHIVERADLFGVNPPLK